MARAAQMIASDAELRLRERRAQRERAQSAPAGDMETIQMKILKLLREHELSEQGKAVGVGRPSNSPAWSAAHFILVTVR